MTGKSGFYFGVVILLTINLFQLRAQPLSFAVPAMNSGLDKLQQWTAVVEYLEAKSDLEIELHIVKDHKLLEDGILNRKYDAGFVNALWQERLIRTGLVSSIAGHSVNGSRTFTTSIIVHKDSVIRTMEDVKDSYVAFTVPFESLGGFYVPAALFLVNGINPMTEFRQLIYADTYLNIMKGVAFGVVDAGAVLSDYLEMEHYRRYADELRVIYESEEIPRSAIIARTDLKRRMVTLFMETLIGMKDNQEGREILDSTGLGEFEIINSNLQTIPENYMEMIGSIDAFSG